MAAICAFVQRRPPGVADVLERFLADFLRKNPPLSADQRRAIRAITDCRTAAMGGVRFACASCPHKHFAWHSCNHKACPRCGREATAEWVERELAKRVNAPYFMVTFTLPEELRSCFFGPLAKEAFDLFFAAASAAMREKLAGAKGFKAEVNGFTAVLQTWGQQMQFHPHLHLLVPGAGIRADGKVVRVKNPKYLVKLPLLQGAFKAHFRERFEALGWQTDPCVWRKTWGVHIQPAGSGAETIKYLGAYVSRSVIADSRIVGVSETDVTFKWQDRSDNRINKPMTVTGVEFTRRYLRHVLPRGLRSIRYYGFCHPAAVAKRERVRIHTGTLMVFGTKPSTTKEPVNRVPTCPHCKVPMGWGGELPRRHSSRAPPIQGPRLLA